jgi:hypothetical protein
MTVLSGFAVVLGLMAAGGLWELGASIFAFGCRLLVLAANAARDIGFSARMPVMLASSASLW